MKLFLVFVPSFFCLVAAAQDFKEVDALIGDFQFEKALQLLSNSQDTSDTRVYLQRGHCYFRLGDYKSAIQSYKKVLSLDSINRTALIQLGQLHARNNDYFEAQECYERLISIDSLNSFYYKQYASLAANVDVPMATVLYTKALQLNPKDIESYSAFGNILLEAEDFTTLDSLLERGLQLDSLQPSLLLLSARSLFGQHKYKNVISVINKILIKNDPQPVYARLMGVSYFQLDDYAKVIPCMEFLVNTKQKGDWIHYYLSVSYRELNQLSKAIEEMNLAIDEGISDNIGVYYSQLARTYEESKDYKKAIHYYQAAYENSKSKILLYHLARNYDVYFKDKSVAAAYYKLYLESDDTIKVAREYSKYRLNTIPTKE